MKKSDYKYKYGYRIFPRRKWIHDLLRCHRYDRRLYYYDWNGNLQAKYLCSCGAVTYDDYVAARSKI